MSESTASSSTEVVTIDLKAEERRFYGEPFNDAAKTCKLDYLIRDDFFFVKKIPLTIHIVK